MVTLNLISKKEWDDFKVYEYKADRYLIKAQEMMGCRKVSFTPTGGICPAEISIIKGEKPILSFSNGFINSSEADIFAQQVKESAELADYVSAHFDELFN